MYIGKNNTIQGSELSGFWCLLGVLERIFAVVGGGYSAGIVFNNYVSFSWRRGY